MNNPLPKPPTSSPRPAGHLLPLAAGAALIGLLLLAFKARTWPSLAAAAAVCPNQFCDFLDYYYPMGEAIFGAGLPVPGFLYSPAIALLLAVFPPLGPAASLILWGILQFLFVYLYLLLFRRLVPAGLPVQLLFVALVLCSYPLLLNLMGGQVSVFMMVGLLGALDLEKRGGRAAAAGLFAFAVGFKFYPIIFLAPFAARRDRRLFLCAIVACVGFLLVFPGLLLGGGDTLRFYGALVDAFRESGWVVTNPHSQYFPHVVLRLAGGLGFDAHALLPLLRWVAFGVAAANMGFVFLVQRARLRHADLWSFQLVFLTIPFVLKTAWPHDFVFISFTQALLAWRLLGKEKGVPFYLLLTSMVFSNIVFFNLVGEFARYGFCGFLFWADLALLTALYLELLPPALRAGVDLES